MKLTAKGVEIVRELDRIGTRREELSEELSELDESLDRKAREALDAGVPMSRVADAARLERSTLYRRGLTRRNGQ